MTSHGHMTHQEKDRIFRGSGDEDLLTLSPIYCDSQARTDQMEEFESWPLLVPIRPEFASRQYHS